MILTLEVTGPQAGTLGAASRKVFDAAGGTIGRLPSNYWVLQHPYVSSRHALIRYQNGVFTIEDTSTNGVFVNSPDNRLVRGEQYVLKTGDAIFIDPFEIRASIAGAAKEAPASALSDDPFALPDVFGDAGAEASGPAPAPAYPDDLGDGRLDPVTGQDLDPMDLLGYGAAPTPPPKMRRAEDLAGGSALSDHSRPPDVPAPAPAQPARGGLIPADYDPLRPDEEPAVPSSPPSAAPPRPSARSTRAAPAPPPVDTGSHARPVRPRATSPGMKRPAGLPAPGSPRHAEPPAPAAAVPAAPARPSPRPVSAPAPGEGASGASLDLAAMLAGAGLDPAAVTPDLARSFGRILRVVVSGVMDVLQARQRIKDEFGMRMTTFRPADNNPLKFSANVEDALHNLLVKRNAAYLGPVEAFEDAFVDVRNHQMAMLAGLRVAFEAMLAEFDPDRLQEQFDRQGKKGSLLAVPAKMRYWDLYREKFGDMVKDAEASFAELFGDEFARAYEAQLERLKGQGRSDKR